MSVGRLIGIVVVILVLFAIISDPQDSASNVREGAGSVGDAGSQVTLFLSTLVGDMADDVGTTSTTSDVGGDQVSDVPSGGVETGDGSTEPRG